MKQEINHTREHIAFNRLAEDHGYDIKTIDKRVEELLALTKGRPAIANLAVTMALEHYTAMMAHEFLANPQHFETSDPEVSDMWRWHAVEEIEHKGGLRHVEPRDEGLERLAPLARAQPCDDDRYRALLQEPLDRCDDVAGTGRHHRLEGALGLFGINGDAGRRAGSFPLAYFAGPPPLGPRRPRADRLYEGEFSDALMPAE